MISSSSRADPPRSALIRTSGRNADKRLHSPCVLGHTAVSCSPARTGGGSGRKPGPTVDEQSGGRRSNPAAPRFFENGVSGARVRIARMSDSVLELGRRARCRVPSRREGRDHHEERRTAGGRGPTRRAGPRNPCCQHGGCRCCGGRRHAGRSTRSPPARPRSHRRHGRRAPERCRVARPGRGRPGRMGAAQRPGNRTGAGSARCRGDHLREPAQRHLGCCRTLSQGGQRRAPPGERDRPALEPRHCLGPAHGIRGGRAAGRLVDPRRGCLPRCGRRGHATDRLRRLPDSPWWSRVDRVDPRACDRPGHHRW